MKINKFYVYVYLDPRKPGNYTYGEYEFDYEPFYVGKGEGKRWLVHLNNSHLKNDTNKFKVNKIKKIIKETNQNPIVIKYKDFLSSFLANNLEIKMIINIGRYDIGEGPLTNLTDGGDGILNVSKETRNKISKSLTGKLKSEDHKKNLRKPKSEEQKIKQSIIMTGRQALFKTKQLMSKIHSSENNFNNKWKYELSNGKNYFTFFTFDQRNIIRAKFSRKKSNIIVFKNVTITRIIKEVANG